MAGKAVRDFALPSTGGGTCGLSERRGKKLVLYFHPGDNTPGRTVEGANKTVCAQFGVMKTKNMSATSRRY